MHVAPADRPSALPAQGTKQGAIDGRHARFLNLERKVSTMLVRLSAVLALASLLATLPAFGAQAVGVHRLVLADPVDGQREMSAVAFYPASGEPTRTELGFYQVDAGMDAPIATGHFPLVLLSHGNGGSPLAHHDLATALARRGFVVLAVLHTGDNYKDQSRSGTL
eukprot:gene8156-10060_t